MGESASTEKGRAIIGSAPYVVVHPLSICVPGLPRPANSDPATLRRPEVATYRCFLPDLTGFVGFCRAGPGLQRRFSPVVP